MSNRRILLGSLAFAAIGISTAIACGPDFPWELLNDRTATLKATPVNSFAFAASHLAPAPAGLKLSGWQAAHLEPNYDYGQSSNKQSDEREALEKDRLTAEQVKAIQEMRLLLNMPDEQILKAGESLPADVRLYTAGAIAYTNKNYPKAQKYFQDAAAITPATVHSVMAGYMLGQTYDQQNDDDKAVEAYDLLQKSVIAGAPDPLDLAIDAYGEKARMLLDKAGGLIGEKDYKEGLPNRGALLVQAAQLYAQQAATGSPIGVASLKEMAQDLTAHHSPDLELTIADPLIQRLVVASVLAERYDDQTTEGVGQAVSERTAPAEGTPIRPVMAKLLQAMTANGVKTVDSSDRLAALAYRTGQYDQARQFAAQSTSPMGLWLQAKLAVQAGDLNKAAEAYSAALKALAADKSQISIDPGNQSLLAGEQGTLSLARGDYLMALQQLYARRPDYHDDALYIAERVLTTDELKQFVDANVPQPPMNPSSDQQYTDSSWAMDTPEGEAQELRNILGNKLVRDGKYEVAIPYFDPKLHDAADQYAKAIAVTQGHAGGITLTKAFYDTAVIERHNGMELLGYYGPPDERATDGYFEGGVNRDKLEGGFIGDDEKKRFAATQSVPNTRYHYREIAADHAEKAADLLPPRSQAFAATLCNAAQWTTDAGHKQQIYQRYVRQGAIVEFAGDFGHNCPAPDFVAAQHFGTTHLLHRAHRAWHRRSVKLAAAGTGAIVILGGVIAVLKRQRKVTAR